MAKARVYFVHTPNQKPTQGQMCSNIKDARTTAKNTIKMSNAVVQTPELYISVLVIDDPSLFIITMMSSNETNHQVMKFIDKAITRKLLVTGAACGRCPACNEVSGQIQLPLFETMLVNNGRCTGRLVKYSNTKGRA